MKEKIIKSARSWIGTPFKHQGRVKNQGTDCLGLIVGIAKECDLKTRSGQSLAEYDVTGYDLSIDSDKLSQFLASNLELSHKIEPGCLAILSFDSNPQHLAIISEYSDHSLGIIHADIKSACVTEHFLDEVYLSRITKIYKLG